MSRKRSVTKCIAVFLLLNWVSVCRVDAVEKTAERLVEEIKQIVRSEGSYGDLSLAKQRSFAGRRIAMLYQLKSPEGVAGLIEIILDPGFIAFDDEYSRDRNGVYQLRQVGDPMAGPMVKTCWYLYTQPLAEEAAIPQIGTDRSWEYRRGALYGGLAAAELIADCTAWCREIQAGRMTFQMEGDPTRYNRLGKAASESRSVVRRDYRNEGAKNEPGESKASEKEGRLTWVYVLLGTFIAVALGVLLKQKLAKS
jgi:hypothetical protein